MSRYWYNQIRDGGDVGGYVIIEVVMLIYRIGNKKYKIEIRPSEQTKLELLQTQLSIEDLKLLQLIFRIGLYHLVSLMK